MQACLSRDIQASIWPRKQVLEVRRPFGVAPLVDGYFEAVRAPKTKRWPAGTANDSVKTAAVLIRSANWPRGSSIPSRPCRRATHQLPTQYSIRHTNATATGTTRISVLAARYLRAGCLRFQKIECRQEVGQQDHKRDPQGPSQSRLILSLRQPP